MGALKTTFSCIWVSFWLYLAFLASQLQPINPLSTSAYSRLEICWAWVLAIAYLNLEAAGITWLARASEFAENGVTKVTFRFLTFFALVLITLWTFFGFIFRSYTFGFPLFSDITLLRYALDQRTFLYMGPDYYVPPLLALVIVLWLLSFFIRLVLKEARIGRRSNWFAQTVSLAIITVSGLCAIAHPTARRAWEVGAHRTLPQSRILYGIAMLAVEERSSSTYSDHPPTRHTSYVAELPRGRDNLPNVFIVVVEALRRDVVMDAVTSTRFPGVAKIASYGSLYSKAFSNATDTDYSFGAILSGTYPKKLRYRDNARSLPFGSLGLPELFKALNYRTAAFVVFNWVNCDSSEGELGSQLQRYGCGHFDVVIDPTTNGRAEEVEAEEKQKLGIPEDATVDRVKTVPLLDRDNLRQFKKWVHQDSRAPHFGFIYLHATHSPYSLPPTDAADYTTDSIYDRQTYSPSRAAEMKNRYVGAFAYLDDIVEDYFEVIRSLPRDSILIFTGDHGEAFNEKGVILHAAQILPEVISVPLIIVKGHAPCSPQTQRIAGHIDIAPTILDLLDLPPFPGYQGVSLCRPEPSRRNLFVTSQAFSDSDGVVGSDKILVRDNRLGGTMLYDSESGRIIAPNDDVRTEVIDPMDRALDLFLARQMAFFAMPTEVRRNLLPPRHE